jgi:hypothetical protein
VEKNFEMTIVPNWPEIDTVYNKANNYFSSFNFNLDYVDRVTMVTCELVENAIKYGNFQNEEKVKVGVKIKNDKVTIVVKNPIGEKSLPYLRELDKTIQWVRSFQNSYEAYIERMRRISTEPLNFVKSELGIVRITHEGQATIDFIIHDGKMLNVSAVLESI